MVHACAAQRHLLLDKTLRLVTDIPVGSVVRPNTALVLSLKDE